MLPVAADKQNVAIYEGHACRLQDGRKKHLDALRAQCSAGKGSDKNPRRADKDLKPKAAARVIEDSRPHYRIETVCSESNINNAKRGASKPTKTLSRSIIRRVVFSEGGYPSTRWKGAPEKPDYIRKHNAN